MRWTGNGLADGTAITSTGLANTAGNGDTVAYAASGTTGGMTTAGDGIEVYGTGDIRRLEGSYAAVKAVVTQVFFTPQQAPTNGTETLTSERSSASTRAGGLNHASTNRLLAINAANATLATAPVMTNGHRFQVDRIIALSASPTTTNGRQVMRVRNLTDATWNGGIDWFYDSGFTINAGTADLTVTWFGKINSATLAQATPSRLEQLGWARITDDLSTKTARADIEPYFMASPYGGAGDTTVLAVPATAVTAGKAPTVAAETTRPTTGAAAASAATPAPTVTTQATVQATASTAAAIIPAPTVVSQQAPTVAAPAATTSAAAVAPLVGTTGSAQITAPTATATAATATPTATASKAAVIQATPASAAAATPAPLALAAATIPALVAAATAQAFAPLLTATAAATTLPPTAVAASAALAPSVIGASDQDGRPVANPRLTITTTQPKLTLGGPQPALTLEAP